MRKTIFFALLSLGALTNPVLKAEPTSSYSQMLSSDKPLASWQVESILKQVSLQTGEDYKCLCDMYDAGDIQITKLNPGEGYEVRLVLGGTTIISIIDTL